MANELTYPQGFIDAINNLKISTPTFAFIHVTYPEGSICTAESSDGDFIAAEGTEGEYTFAVPEPVQESATWTISCNDSNTGDSDEIEVVVNEFGQKENVVLKYADPVLNNNDWELISIIAQRGTGDNYWDVGDCKAITLNGKIGNYLTLNSTILYVFILDFNHPVNKTIADNNIIFGGFKTALTGGVDVCLCDSGYSGGKTSGIWFNINHSSQSNYGGWKGCDFRYDILGAIDTMPSPYNAAKTTSTSGSDATITTITSPVANTLISALPADMRSVLKLWTRWIDNKGKQSNIDANVTTCVDAGISLLAEYEIFGTRSYANIYERNHQKQMQYYAVGNSKVKYKHNATTVTANWWEPSARYDSAVDVCAVAANSSAAYGNAYYSFGLAPAFCVGNTLSYSVIEFIIGTTKCYAQEGMTWQEWANSEYNRTDFGVSNNTINSGGIQFVQYQNTNVIPNEIIVANRAYTIYTFNGGAAVK